MPVPVTINTLSVSAIRWLPCVGKKKVAAVIAKRPFAGIDTYRKVVGRSVLDGLIQF
jgi:radical SAM superfamily enzyme with C-terminal helix-hairpin-helix motif